MHSQTKIFSQVVGDHMRPPLIMSEDALVSEMVGRMADASVTAALVTNSDGLLTGIITERDILRRVTLRCQGDETLRAVMTSPVESLTTTDYLYLAIARMRHFGWRHMPIVDFEARPVGLIVMRDALSVASSQTLERIEIIAREGGLDALREIKAAQIDLASDLLEDSIAAVEVQRVLSDINRDIHRRLIDHHLAELEREGWGSPPVKFSAIVMGSGGRGESYLYPDQDNGFVLDNYPDKKHNQIDAYFRELALRLTRDLDAIGFPFCKGYVMATNPLWRKTRSQWRQQLSIWGRRRSTIAIQLSDIFFDFTHCYGEREFSAELRVAATEMASKSPIFLEELQRVATEYGVALGWFGRFVTEKHDKGHVGAINLKHMGSLPLVSCLRVLALRQRITKVGTIERAGRLHEQGVLDSNEHDYLVGAYRLIATLLLRQQVADFKANRMVSNYVHPDNLSEREEDMLHDSFRAIEELRKRVRAEFTADVF